MSSFHGLVDLSTSASGQPSATKGTRGLEDRSRRCGGVRLGIPFSRTRAASSGALENWLSAARIEDRPVFGPSVVERDRFVYVEATAAASFVAIYAVL